jgi:hypothetical protein
MAFSPLTHALALFVIGWLALQLRNSVGRGELRAARVSLFALLLGWLLASSWLALRGAYLARPLLVIAGSAVLPTALVLLALVSRDLRALLGSFASRVPAASFVRVHALRIAALGTIYKWWAGALPAHFILPVGVPDLLIGLSALPLAARLAGGSNALRRLETAWHLVGAGVLLLALPLMQLSQRGPLWIYRELPSTDLVLAFPMAIVPTFIAPLLVLLHGAALYGRRLRPASAP